jgi:hypothetical protein
MYQIMSTHGNVLFEHGETLIECITAADLRGADLTEACLRGADLRGAYLRGADLRAADLRAADLREAYLREANLTEAYLRAADLSEANLTEAYLRGADLTEADLTEACLRGADLTAADLRGAALRGADLTEACLMGADLMGADLMGADLSDAKGLVKKMGVAQGNVYWKRFDTGLCNNGYHFHLGLNTLDKYEVFADDERVLCSFPGFHFASRSWCAVNYPHRPYEAKIRIPEDAQINEPWSTDGKASASAIEILQIFDTQTGEDITDKFRK